MHNRPPQVCTECGEKKPLSEFYKNSKAKSGFQWKCKACINSYNRRLHLRKSYGMSLDDYEAMLASQGGGCAVCGATTAGRKGHSMHVDHDHVSGQVRGILCGPCNSAIGHANEDADRLRDLADYIEAHQ